MSQVWADKIAQQLFERGLIQTGICLILGAADTGKTSLAAALAKQAALSKPVGIVDADIGQSHIGPPTTVGWAVFDNQQADFSQAAIGGISFVGNITPTGHLLQLTAAIAQSVEQAAKRAELIIIDTPGFIYGPAAAALWWMVQRMLQPKLILAVQRSNELTDITNGLKTFDSELEMVKSPPQIPTKSPQERRRYRQSQFEKYFENTCLYNISLNDVAVQSRQNLRPADFNNRLAALRNGAGIDLAIGLINNWQDDAGIAAVKAPQVDTSQVRCLVVGDISIEIT